MIQRSEPAPDRWFRHRLQKGETFRVQLVRDNRGRDHIEVRIVRSAGTGVDEEESPGKNGD